MKILLKIIRWIITIFLVVVLSLIIFQKITHNKLTIGNIYIFQVVSESMLPKYKVGDVIVVKKTDEADLKIGDDVTYLGSYGDLNGIVVTHRIVKKDVIDNKQYFTTKGISNNVEDPPITIDNIYGKVVYHTVLFSFVGRLMTNTIVYYLLFIGVGVSFAYEIISTYIIKEDDNYE